MKCTSCGGRLEGTMTFCPFCGVRQDVDLRQIHFRDLGGDASLPCPSCATPLDVIKFETDPAIRIERCNSCHGMFFNPGELEALLDTRTNPLVWLDPAQLSQISDDFGFNHEIVYRKCPMCAERMSHLNFAGRSGVILDRCGTHGVWVEGGELRRLNEWWRAGGKLIFQQHEADRTKRLYQTSDTMRSKPLAGSIESPDQPEPWTWSSGGGVLDATDLLAAAVETIISCVTD
jgi:Zn-finger nucleic acid-binding protein